MTARQILHALQFNTANYKWHQLVSYIFSSTYFLVKLYACQKFEV